MVTRNDAIGPPSVERFGLLPRQESLAIARPRAAWQYRAVSRVIAGSGAARLLGGARSGSAYTSDRSRVRSTSSSEGTTVRRGADGIATTLGTATT